MYMLYVCVLWASCGSPQCCVLHNLQFVNAGRASILQSRFYDYLHVSNVWPMLLLWVILSCVEVSVYCDSVNVYTIYKRTPPWGTPVLNWRCMDVLFRYIDVVYDELHDVAWMLVCSNLWISVCMLMVSKVLLIHSITVIVRAGGGGIWLNPFAIVLFNVSSAVIEERCVLLPCVVCLLLCKKEGSLPVSLLRGDIWHVWGALVPVFVGFGMGTMLANVHMCGIMLLLRAVLNMLVRNVRTSVF